MRRTIPLAVCVAATLAGCNLGPLGGLAWSRCLDAAREYNGEVAGAFDTTIGSVRQLSAGADPPLFADLDDGVAATLCYVDADIAKGPPPGPNGEIREPFDRVVLALVGDRIEVALAGYRGDVPVLAPPS